MHSSALRRANQGQTTHGLICDSVLHVDRHLSQQFLVPSCSLATSFDKGICRYDRKCTESCMRKNWKGVIWSPTCVILSCPLYGRIAWKRKLKMDLGFSVFRKLLENWGSQTLNHLSPTNPAAAAAAAAKSLQSCPTLCDPRDGSPPGSPVPGILQARTLEWVAISFSNAWKWKVNVKSLSRVRLLVTPWTSAHQAPPSMGFSRQEYWSGVPLPSLTNPAAQSQNYIFSLASFCACLIFFGNY